MNERQISPTDLSLNYALDSRTRLIFENVEEVKLVSGCEAVIFYPPKQPFKTFVLACPGVDFIKLWPLPVEYNWDEEWLIPRPGEEIAIQS